MVNRIKIDIANQIFKVSRPGYDVGSAPLAQIAFDGFTGDPYAGVYMAGATAWNDPQWTQVQVGSLWVPNNPLSYRYSRVISLGKTFSSPPQVIWTLKTTIPDANGGYNKYGVVNKNTVSNVETTRGISTWASCSTTDLTLRIDFSDSGQGTVGWTFAYMVFQT